MKINKLFFVAVFGILCAGCYNDFDTPAPAKVWTDEDMALLGLEPISIKEMKNVFINEFGSLENTGSNNSWADTKTVKFGASSTSIEADFSNIHFREDIANRYIRSEERRGGKEC